MRKLHHFYAGLLLIALSACGGGGGGGGGDSSGTSISVSPTSVSFTAIEGDPLPAATNEQVSFVGDGVVVGYAPGVPQPSWLNVSQSGNASASSVSFSLSVSDTAAVGTRSTSVRFVTGKADGSQVKYQDVPVTYTITASDLAVSANTPSFTFIANSNGVVPAPQNVVLTFNGSALSVSGAPSWLTVVPPANPNVSPATYSIAVNSTAFPGGSTQSADLVFVTTRNGSTLQRTATVHVDFNVVQPFDVSSTASPLSFAAIAKSSQGAQPASYALSVIGSQANWTIAADQPWIQFSPASGTNAGLVTVTVNSATLGHGNFSGNVTVTDANSMTSRTFPVTLANRAPNLTVAPGNLNFTVNTSSSTSAFSQTVLISDELNGAQGSEAVSWTLQSGSASWLKWTPASGSSAPAVTATASLVATELQKLVPGQYSTTITLAAVNAAGAAQTVTIPVTLSYEPAYVTFVAPYVGIANQAGTFVVRGENFAQTGAPVTVSIGSTQVANVTPDGDTQMHVNYPAMGAGTYPVSVVNTAGLAASDANLVLINPPALAYQALAAPTTRQRLVYDAERQVLYAVDQTDQQIEKFTLSGGVWSAGTPYILPQVQDIALTTNGRLLIAITQGWIDDIPLTGAPFIATQRDTEPWTTEAFANLVTTNDGHEFVASVCLCSGFTNSYLYGSADHSLVQNPYPIGLMYDGIVGAGADGTRAYFGSKNVSPSSNIGIYNSLDHSIVNSPVAINLTAVSVSGNASVVIFENTDVYSGALSLMGYLPAPAGVALASRDSTRAYVFRDDAGGGGPRLDIYNLNGALQTGAVYPLLKTVSMADAPNTSAGAYSTIALAETPDGNTVFVSGNSKLLVVPVN